jgi:RNA polymerase sigma factor (TIGR02999 family)
MDSPFDVTRILKEAAGGQREALDRLLPILYDRMRAMAHARIRNESPGRTLNTTGLVHEAYLKLVQVDQVQWKDREHFLAMASEGMRRILVDAARRRQALKRGGAARREELQDDPELSDDQAATITKLDDCLRKMAEDHPRTAQALTHVHFGGLSNEEAARILEVSPATLERDLRFARAWLAREWGPDRGAPTAILSGSTSTN